MVSTLKNGLTVVTEDESLSTTLALTFPAAGSANEEAHEEGAAFANKHMNFRTGSGVSTASIHRIMEDHGATIFNVGGRTSATVGITCLPETAPHLLQLLATSCSYERWDLREALACGATEAEEAQKVSSVSTT